MPIAYKETVSGTPYIKLALSLDDVEELVMHIWSSEIEDRTMRVDQIATLLNECYNAHTGSDVTDDFEWVPGEYLDDEEEEEEEEEENGDEEEEEEEEEYEYPGREYEEPEISTNGRDTR